MAKKRKSRFWVFFWVALGALFLAAMILPQIFPALVVLAFDTSGEPEEVYLVHLDGLDGMIVSEAVELEAGDLRKISIFDLQDGRRLSYELADGDTQCWGLLDELLWCHSEEFGLHARSPANAQVVWSRDDLLAAQPALAGKLRTRRDDNRFDPERHAIHLRTNEGYWYTLKTADRSLEKCPDNPDVHSSGYSPALTRADLGSDQNAILIGSDRQRLRLGDHESQASYLKAQFLFDQLTGQVIRLDGPDSLAMIHFERMDKGSDGLGLLLSRIDLNGQELWRVQAETPFSPPDEDTDRRVIQSAHLSQHGLLLFFTFDHAGKILMVDPAKGQIRWTSEL